MLSSIVPIFIRVERSAGPSQQTKAIPPPLSLTHASDGHKWTQFSNPEDTKTLSHRAGPRGSVAWAESSSVTSKGYFLPTDW